jgi:hypothetical protein
MRSVKVDKGLTPSRYRQVMDDPERSLCATPDCGRKEWAKGLCSVCLKMLRDYGAVRTGWHDPAEILRRRTEFFLANVDQRGPGECWPWKRKPTNTGYGQLRWVVGTLQAHRVAYLLAYGTLPDGMDIDHTCHHPLECTLKRNCPHRLCCNPAHLEAVPRAVNLERSDQTRPANGKHRQKRRCEPGCTCARHQAYNRAGGKPCEAGCTCNRHPKTDSCPRCGTPYTVRRSGRRVCKPCENASARQRRARERENQLHP